jgi:predicted CXXCH cytochrome family protein
MNEESDEASPRIRRLGSLAVVSLFLLGALLVACSTVNRTVVLPPEIEGAHYIGNRNCADCHTNITRIFPASAHGKLNSDDLKFASVTGCESCHGPGSKHAQAGGGRGKFIINPGKDATVCFNCHLDVHAEFNLPQHHPVIENRMNCVQCHDPHGHDVMKPAGGLAMARLNQSCAQCHREQARPFVFEHEALREGCTTCHDPHGSINRQLLTERDNNLCLKCHVQMAGPATAPGEFFIGRVNHAEYVKRGTCWSAGCHSAVHGSNVNPLMLY